MRKRDTCIDCGGSPVVGRNRCSPCMKEHNRRRARDSYALKGRPALGEVTCPLCGVAYKKYRKNQVGHFGCTYIADNKYKHKHRSRLGSTLGRYYVENVLGLSVPSGYVIHHLDTNPDNNSIANLVACGAGVHARLHRKLSIECAKEILLIGSKDIPRDRYSEILSIITREWFCEYSALIFSIRESDAGVPEWHREGT